MAYNITSEVEVAPENASSFPFLEANSSLGVEMTGGASDGHKSQDGVFESSIIIPLYVVIFVLSVVGNSLVLATLGQNKRMRTITNVYLLNLEYQVSGNLAGQSSEKDVEWHFRSIPGGIFMSRTVPDSYLKKAVSDLLLGVFCMPFTLVGQVLRNFIFGATMCKMIPYFQAVSVSVGVWTLVAISLERYFAICRPLKSRRWQTQFHAYKMIACVWLSSLMWTSPILLVSRLKALKMGRHKCREEWPNATSERVFNLFLDIVLLLVPLIIMTLAYSLIVSKLWKGLKHEIKHTRPERCGSTATINGVVLNKKEDNATGGSSEPSSSKGLGATEGRSKRETITSRPRPSRMKLWLKKVGHQVGLSNQNAKSSLSSSVITLPVLNSSPRSNEEDSREPNFAGIPEKSRYTFTRHAIRSNYMDKSIEAKKKVIRMLFVVVAEFFICWAPLHILNTWYLFSPEVIYKYVGATGISLVQLLAYISSCCNPITYCFMNRKFRQAFLNVFSCEKPCLSSRSRRDTFHMSSNHPIANNSEMSVNDSMVCPGRAAAINRSEMMTLETEDRV